MLRPALTLLFTLLACATVHGQSHETTTRSLYLLEGKVRALEHVQFQLLAHIAITRGIDASKNIVSDAKAVLSKEIRNYCNQEQGKFQPSESPHLDEVRKEALKILGKMMRLHCKGAQTAIGRMEEAIRGFEDALER